MESTDRWTETTAVRRRNWLLVILFIVGLGLRLHGGSWGFPHHFHPDERQIVDFQTPKVKLGLLNPSKSVPLLVKGDWDELGNMVDDLNTKFFAYGPLPMYSVAITVEVTDWINRGIQERFVKHGSLHPAQKKWIQQQFPRMKTGKGRIVTGRFISAILSALTILAVFRLGQYLYNPKVAYLAATFFTFTVLSVQQAHFMIVDGPQTFLVAWAMYYLVRVAMGDRRRDYYYAAVFIGLAMATKFSTAPIGLAYILAHFLSMHKGRREGLGNWWHWLAGGLAAVVVMTMVMPFWLIDSKEFFHDIREQSGMVQGVADLPYTIQFEHTTPFIYMIKNMILWSMGLPFGLVAFIGLGAALRRIWKKSSDLGNIVIISFVLPLLYFNGTFFAKFLRYTLVIMPFMAIFAARWLYGMKIWAGRGWARTVTTVSILGTILWALAFQSIYLEPHTRIQASDWIYDNVKEGLHIIQESGWDDALPVTTDNGNVGRYKTKQLGIYKEPDNERKASKMAEVLEWGDVVILSSRKHYGSVCRVPNRYPVSTNFYKLLFDEKLGFQHVKTFDNPPQIGPVKFRDDLADESFRVYEHPRVDIFVKESALNQDQMAALMVAPPIETAAMTYEELMTRRPPTEVGSRVNYPVFRWILALELFGVICFPMAFIIFGRFDHKGYPFAKIIGLLSMGYICWLLPSLRMFAFSRELIAGVILLFIYLNHMIYRKNRNEINSFVRERWWSVAGYELLFLAVFTIFALLRSYNPDIYWSESLMDLGFLNAVLRADFFPPEDPWITAQGVNYYYYGHYLAGFLTRLTGVEPHYGYNLFFITIPAIVSLSIAAILIALTRRIWVGLTGVVFAIFIGNLDGVAQAANILAKAYRRTNYAVLTDNVQSAVGLFLNLGRQDRHFRFFRSAHELIPDTVHEFPFWSFNFMDLHAHTMAMMLSTFFIALQLLIMRHRKSGLGMFGTDWLQRVLTLGIMCITFGAMVSTNSWDVPTQFLLLIFVSLWIAVFADRQPGKGRRTPVLASDAAIISSDAPGRIYGGGDQNDEDDDDRLDETVVDLSLSDLDPQAQTDGSVVEQSDAASVTDSDDDCETPSSEDETELDSLDETEPGTIISSETGGYFSDILEEPDAEDAPEETKIKDDQVNTDSNADETQNELSEDLAASVKSSLLFPDIDDEPEDSTATPEQNPQETLETDPDIDSDTDHNTDTAPESVTDTETDTETETDIETDTVSRTDTTMDDDKIEADIVNLILNEETENEQIFDEMHTSESWGQIMGRWVTTALNWLYKEALDSGAFLWKLLWPLFAILFGAMLLHMPYLMSFHRAGMGIGNLIQYKQTTNLDGYLTMFGFFLFIFLTQFIKWWWTVQEERGYSRLRSAIILCFVVILLTSVGIVLQIDGVRGVDYSVFLINVFLLFLIVSILIQGYPTSNQAFPLILAIFACGIVAGCEVVFVKDFYAGGAMRRFNTVFKFYLQAWFMFAVVSAYLISRRMRISSHSFTTGWRRMQRVTAKWSWNLVFMLLLSGSLIFTVWGVYARHNRDEYRRVKLPLTLDGWGYLKQGINRDVINEYRAINWLQTHVKGSPTILEASGADYLYRYGDVSGNTGLPTVLGWWSHVDQREYVSRKGRGNRRDRKLNTGQMKKDIIKLYNSADIEEVLMLLGKYQIEYIFVGPTERKEKSYSEFGLQKFDEMSQFISVVYSNPSVKIYKVNDYGHSIDLAQATEGNDALNELRQRMQEREEQEKLKEAEREKAMEKRMREMPPRGLFKGVKGIARGMYSEPRSLGCASDGSIYIGDFRNHRVQKYDMYGEWLAMWGETGGGPGQFKDICDVAADTKNVYVMDTFNNRIQVFDPNGKFRRIVRIQGSSVSHPRGIAVMDGDLFVADTGNSRVLRISPTGKVKHTIGKAGNRPGQFSGPIGITVSNGKVYVADVGNQRIQVLSTEGEFLRAIPVTAWEPGVFNEPYIAVSSNETIYYSDPIRGVVYQLSPDGEKKKFEKDASGKKFGLPMGLAVTPNDEVLVVDARNHRVHQLGVGKPLKRPAGSRDRKKTPEGAAKKYPGKEARRRVNDLPEMKRE